MRRIPDFKIVVGMLTTVCLTLHSYSCNMAGDVWGVLEVAGYDTKIIPTTTMMNNYIHCESHKQSAFACDSRNGSERDYSRTCV